MPLALIETELIQSHGIFEFFLRLKMISSTPQRRNKKEKLNAFVGTVSTHKLSDKVQINLSSERD